jgi:hypothetical protein
LRDYHLEMGGTRSWRTRDQVVAVGELLIEEIDELIFARTRDGRLRFELIELFDAFLVRGAGHYSLLEPLPHTPRVTIDRLVVARETWRLSSDELPQSRAESDGAMCLRYWRWAKAIGLPRFVFAHTPLEKKPMYVDFFSPLLLHHLLKSVGAAGRVTLSEALPTHGQHWLTDAAGDRYTAELRIVAHHQDQSSTNNDRNILR